jgi:hypothetical protein
MVLTHFCSRTPLEPWRHSTASSSLPGVTRCLQDVCLLLRCFSGASRRAPRCIPDASQMTLRSLPDASRSLPGPAPRFLLLFRMIDLHRPLSPTIPQVAEAKTVWGLLLGSCMCICVYVWVGVYVYVYVYVYWVSACADGSGAPSRWSTSLRSLRTL